MSADEWKGRRVGLIVPGFSADRDDWCIPALRNLVRELARTHDVQLFALRYPDHRDPYAVDGATIHPLGGGLATGVARVRLLARARARIAAVHRVRRLDLLHAFWADEPGFLAVTSGRSLRIPAIVSLMGGELARLPQIGYGGQLGTAGRKLAAHALRTAQRVTVGSEYLRRMYLSRSDGPVPLRMPLGVDTALFAPSAVGEVSPRAANGVELLSVASLIPVKDHATLLRALALARTGSAVPELHLHVVGDGPLRGSLEALTSDLGVTAAVTFHGHVRHEKLPAYYRAADLCVQSSLHESQCLAVLEAAACGRATVGTAVGILPELGEGSRVVAPGDPAALGDVILSVLREPGRVAAMGRTARETVAGAYTLSHTVAQLDALYAGLDSH